MTLTAVLVVEFPDGTTPVGAAHGLRPVSAALSLSGIDIIGEALGNGDATLTTARITRAFWETNQPPIQTFTCPCGLKGDLAVVVEHTRTCPQWAGA